MVWFCFLQGRSAPCVLVRGPQGCGKALLVTHASAICDAAITTIDCSLRGVASVNKLCSAFEEASRLGMDTCSVLLLKDLDRLLHQNRRRVKTAVDSVLMFLRRYMCRLKNGEILSSVIFVATTSRPSDIHSELRTLFDLEVCIFTQ